VLDGAAWRGTSVYPASQPWADELERLLAFLAAQGQFERFLSRLRGKESQLEGALAEIRLAYFLHRNGFAILEWEPVAVEGRPGDLSVSWQRGAPIFVEVKGPGWESELTADELKGARKGQGKYVDSEVRSVNSVDSVLRAIDKCLPKLAIGRANLVVIVDNLHISPTSIPDEWLKSSVQQHISRPSGQAVSGVFFLRPELYHGAPLEYFYRFVNNPAPSAPLPDDVLKGWLAANSNRQGPRWAPQ
jgi:hypothetical protein